MRRPPLPMADWPPSGIKEMASFGCVMLLRVCQTGRPATPTQKRVVCNSVWVPYYSR